MQVVVQNPRAVTLDELAELVNAAWQEFLPQSATESARYDSCVRQVTAKGGAANPHAVCRAALGECSEADCPCPACVAKRGAQPLLEQPGVLDVPDEAQEEGWSCGAAVTAAVCRYFGVEPDTEGEAIRALGSSPKDGTDPEHIVQVLQDNGLETVALAGIGLEEVEYFLSKGRPLIVAMQAWGTPEEVAALEAGHYTVVIGVDADSVQIMDPANFTPDELGSYSTSLGGQRVAVPRAEFMKRWRDTDGEGNVYHQYAVAVRGPNA